MKKSPKKTTKPDYELLLLRLMDIENRLGTLEHYTRGYEVPRQTIPYPNIHGTFPSTCDVRGSVND